MSEATLAKLFETRLQAWAENEDLPIAFEGQALKPPAENPYARVDHLPLPTTGAFVEGGHEALTGIYQVSFFGLKGKGLGPLRTFAMSCKDQFPQNLILSEGTFKVQIIEPPSIGPKVDDPESSKAARVMLPLSIQYRADVTS
jgi:hypothetical protein